MKIRICDLYENKNIKITLDGKELELLENPFSDTLINKIVCVLDYTGCKELADEFLQAVFDIMPE